MILDLLVLVGYLTWISLAVLGGISVARWVRDTYRLGREALNDRHD